jgi:ABC-type branched-subunit amino acid transport system substrate-binding protein
MRTQGHKVGRWIGAVTSTGLAVAMCLGLSSTGASAASAPAAPGVTPTQINTGAISTLTGPIASNFESLVPGIRAYFDWINSTGGINGRHLVLAYNLDDGGNPTQFTQLTHTLIDQDHAFAAVGIATAFFSPNYFASTGTPTYGYDVTGNWTPAPNLYAAGGSYLCYACGVPGFAYIIKQVKAKSVAIVGYNITASSAPCQTSANLLKKAGVNVSYVDVNIQYPGTTVATDVQRMQQAGSDMVVSCMDVTGNLTMARAIKQYGLKIKQLWLNGNDQPTLDANESLMQGVYFNIEHVPFASPTKYYPGLKLYLTAMNKYAPKYVDDEVAIQGWQSAALFAAGVKAAGSNLTQANVVAQTNKITNFTANGLTTPINWSNSHLRPTFPSCSANIQVQGTKFVPVFLHGNQVFSCFGPSVKNPVPVTPPAGTPGPS